MKRNFVKLEEAWELGAKVTPNSTQAVAVLFDPELTTPYAIMAAMNTFPSGVDYDTRRLERPAKYSFMAHAEQALIAKCANIGCPTGGKGVYMHWFPCDTCARILIDAGIQLLVCDKPAPGGEVMNQWKFPEAEQMLNEAGVEIIYRD